MKALIIGANGQDASYLAELLLEKKYEVHGTIRRNSVPESQTTRIQHIFDKVQLHYADLTDAISIEQVIKNIQPDEVYHLAAQSHVQISFELPKYTMDANCGGTLAVLEAVRRFSPHSKVYFAATSEMFGNNCDEDGYQRETTKMIPVSPYGCSKLYGYNLCHNYRNSYNMFIASGILFNHESPRRGINFVTNKVAMNAVKIYYGLQKNLHLGNLDAYRDWGHAKDYVNAMWLMLQRDDPKDYVIATGESRSIRDLLNEVFSIKLGMTWEDKIVVDGKYLRPEELAFLKGDASLAKKELSWNQTISFKQMIEEMVNYWMKEISSKI